MKRCLLIITILVSMFLNESISYGYKNINYFNELMDITKCEVKECGIKGCFETQINGQELIGNIKKEIKSKNNMEVYTYNGKGCDKVEFKNYNIKGSIIIQNLNNKKYVTVEILKKCNTNKLKELQSYIEYISKDVAKDKIVYYKYLKGKLANVNLKNLNDELIVLLKNTGAINVDSIDINNGFSTCAYTKMYRPKKNNGKLMDFNYALSNYSSGKYIVIGTPEIITTY